MAYGHSFEKFEQKKIQLECKKKKQNLGEVYAVSNSSKPSPEVLESSYKV